MATNNLVEIEPLCGDLAPADADNEWFVIHIKPRWEKKFASYCFLYKVNYYLPLQDSVRVYHNRKVVFTKPIFPGYIFVKCSINDKSLLFRSGSIVRFINVPNERELLTDLNNIYESLSRKLPIEHHAYVKEGYKVRITKGPFIGVEGIVIDAEDPSEVIVGIHLIQQAICLQVDPSQIELVSRTAQQFD